MYCINRTWSQLRGDGVDSEVQIIEDRRCHCRGKLRETKKNSYRNVWCSSIYDDGWMLIATAFICTASSLTKNALSSTTHHLILHMSKTITLEVKSSRWRSRFLTTNSAWSSSDSNSRTAILFRMPMSNTSPLLPHSLSSDLHEQEYNVIYNNLGTWSWCCSHRFHRIALTPWNGNRSWIWHTFSAIDSKVYPCTWVLFKFHFLHKRRNDTTLWMSWLYI